MSYIAHHASSIPVFLPTHPPILGTPTPPFPDPNLIPWFVSSNPPNHHALTLQPSIFLLLHFPTLIVYKSTFIHLPFHQFLCLGWGSLPCCGSPKLKDLELLHTATVGTSALLQEQYCCAPTNPANPRKNSTQRFDEAPDQKKNLLNIVSYRCTLGSLWLCSFPWSLHFFLSSYVIFAPSFRSYT